MGTKSSSQLKKRFTGRGGRDRLVESLLVQPAIAGLSALARELVQAGAIVEFRAGKPLMIQGGTDNDIYFLVCGSVDILINGRRVATRNAGRHVGEMALVDPTARRSATVVAAEQTVALKVSERQITSIARKHPDFWRRVAVEVASRLRERSKTIREPNATPIVFVGSSGEAAPEAEWIAKSLNRRPVVCRLWTQGVFQLSRTTIEDLSTAALDSDFAAIIMTPDDMTASRGRRRASPRDNVVFELGLFMGAIGRERTFIVLPDKVDIKLPTDLLGVTHMSYSTNPKQSLGQRLATVSRGLWNRIEHLGPK